MVIVGVLAVVFVTLNDLIITVSTEPAHSAIQTMDDIAFLAIVSDSGNVSILKLFSSDSSKTAEMALSPEQFEETVYTSKFPLTYSDGSDGFLLLGISKKSLADYVTASQNIFRGFLLKV